MSLPNFSWGYHHAIGNLSEYSDNENNITINLNGMKREKRDIKVLGTASNSYVEQYFQ